MPNLTIRASPELIEAVKAHAVKHNTNVSDVVRSSVLHTLGNASPAQDERKTDALQSHITDLQAQVTAKDDQIAQLHQLVAMSQQNLATSQRQLEHRPNWWQRLIGLKPAME
jgi:uncharacterized protein YlxW (UPF0749 family)